MLPPEELEKKLKQAITTTENYRQTAIKSGIHSNPGSVIGIGCAFSLFYIFVGITLVTSIFTGYEGIGALYFFLFVGIPLGSILCFYLAHRFFSKKIVGPPPAEDYKIYQKNWIKNLLKPFLQLQSDGKLSAAEKPLFMKGVNNPRLHLFCGNNQFLYDFLGGISCENTAIKVAADVVIIKESGSKKPVFSGIVCQIPFLQILPKSTVQIVPRDFISRHDERLNGFAGIDNHLVNAPMFTQLFRIFSDQELSVEDISYTQLFDFMIDLHHKYQGFTALSLHNNKMWLWLELDIAHCNPDVEEQVWNTLRIDFWDDIAEVLYRCHKIGQDRNANSD